MVAGAIKHAFASAKEDGGDASLVRPSNWNEDHEGGISILDRDLTQQDVANEAAETSIYSFSIPAGVLGATGGVRLTLAGDLLANVTGTVVVRAKLGATTILTASAIDPADSPNRRKWHAVIEVINSAAAAQKCSAALFISSASTDNWPLIGADVYTGIGLGSSVEDTSGALVLQVTVDWSAASANLSFRKEIAVLELLSPA